MFLTVHDMEKDIKEDFGWVMDLTFWEGLKG
jgi:hypothetical protein